MNSNCHIPEEVLEQIFARLPAKSIIKFQTLNKSLFNVINSSRFLHKNLTKTEDSFIALCFTHKPAWSDRCFLDVFLYDDDIDEEKSQTLLKRFRKGVERSIKVFCNSEKLVGNCRLVLNFELPFSVGIWRPLELVGHCNGILCLTDYGFIILVNLLLKEVKMLPEPMFFFASYMWSRQWILVGFGFDITNMDFKVVRIWNSRQRADVCNLKSNAWRKLDEFPFEVEDHHHNNMKYCSTYFDGVIHWCARIVSFGWRILTFNMATEAFELMKFPQDWYDSYDDTRPALFVSNQKSMAFVSYCVINQFVNIWMMNKDYNNKVTWTKLYSIGPLPGLLNPLGFVKKRKFLYYGANGKLVSYDLLNHRCSVVCASKQIQRNNASTYKDLCLRMEVAVSGSSLDSINI